MNTPISYYGGKQRLAGKIVPKIAEHKLYAEPFVGGAAVFFAKEQSGVEVINDLNSELINFYKVCQNNFVALKAEVNITLHSRRLHKDASVVYNNPHLFTELKRAWAVWVLATQSFSSMLDGTFGYDKAKNTTTKKIHNKVEAFDESIAIRLQNVQIECADALYIIRSRDYEEAFFYCDPSYPSDILSKYTKSYGWKTVKFEQKVSVNKGAGGGKMKTEVLTANYPIEI